MKPIDLKRLEQAFERHNIDGRKKVDYASLALCLLNELSPPPRERAPRIKKWTPELKLRLVSEIHELMREQDLAVETACYALAGTPFWRDKVTSKNEDRRAQRLREVYNRYLEGGLDVFENIKTGELIVRQRSQNKTKRGGKYG